MIYRHNSLFSFKKLIHYITNSKTFHYLVLCAISFPLNPFCPRGLRQTATFSIQEILEHFRLTIYPTTRYKFRFKRFLSQVRLFAVPYFFVRSTGQSAGSPERMLISVSHQPRERASGFTYPRWPLVYAKSSIPTILRKNRGP